ncbi:hypothetical protein [Frigoriglobus tundricola]|uniref:Uncharacterized protein n=1 Tax=Frigoriglobus tundricola TaxID=2774151 RepID=A0A6M5Z313_9BACT|nr:hypothetical protein [Frigoriglobus tundricola]QJX00085.1 hypothetical protein FTUN_7709 [Frigoriglobus tundricola]
MAKAKVSADDLVRLALRNAAEATSEVKLIGKDGGLFPSASGANKEAIATCLNAEQPLLKVVRKEGKVEFVTLAPAGFERIASELPEDKVGPLAKSVATALPFAPRIEFIQAVIGKTPLAAPELVALLEEAVAAEKAEQEARTVAAARRKAAEDEMLKALARAREVIEERRANRRAALRREWEVEGQSPAELALHVYQPKTEAADEDTREPASEPITDEEKGFRRDSVDQFAASWRTAWDGKKAEALEYLETAMWNIRGLELRGEPGARVAFDGRYHQCEAPAFTGDAVTIVRPGWVLNEGADRDYVALKAVVEKA